MHFKPFVCFITKQESQAVTVIIDLIIPLLLNTGVTGCTSSPLFAYKRTRQVMSHRKAASSCTSSHFVMNSAATREFYCKVNIDYACPNSPLPACSRRRGRAWRPDE